VPDEDAKSQFVNRVQNLVVKNFFLATIEKKVYKNHILWQVANALGKEYFNIFGFENYVEGDFYACLKALEAAYKALPTKAKKKRLDTIVQHIISQSEVDLGIEWREGIFWPAGAKLLDEALVNEPLQWLSAPNYHNVLAPFEKGLRHFLEAHKYPERLADTVTDMYEALEAMAKVVTCRPKRDLSGNAELFVKKLGLSDYYKKMLKDYISYANEFRHAVEESKERKPPVPQEVEAFVYTTGLFIRLAVESLS